MFYAADGVYHCIDHPRVILRRHKQPFSEVEQYVERMSQPEDKYAVYLELRQYWKAFEVATKMRDPHKLQEV
jgi:hypothetical protein